jgi:hypothetical protein
VLHLLDSAHVVPSSRILLTLMMEAIFATETSVLTTAIQQHIPEEGILLVSLSSQCTDWSQDGPTLKRSFDGTFATPRIVPLLWADSLHFPPF